MGGDVPPLPQYAFMAWCLVRGERRDNCFIFILSSEIMKILCELFSTISGAQSADCRCWKFN